MSKTAIHAAGMQAFEEFVGRAPSFRPRDGQRAMANMVAKTLSEGDLGKDVTNPSHSIAVIQAGTGVGKSVAYSVPAIVAALERKTRVIISTGTVALQEQLVAKDLPAISASLGRSFQFVLAKGRGRYVCKLKLLRASSGDSEAMEEDLFAGDETQERKPAPAASHSEYQIRLYRDLEQALADGTWDGERDSLQVQPGASEWAPVAAEGASCTSRHCEHYNECTYFAARKRIAEAEVVVVNHDLLLSSLGSRLLPSPVDSLVVFDEGHNLPEVATDRFSTEMNLSNLQWFGQFASRLQKACSAVGSSEGTKAVGLLRRIRTSMNTLQGLCMGLFDPVSRKPPQDHLFANGVLPPEFYPELAEMSAAGKDLLSILMDVSNALKERLKEAEGNKSEYTKIYVSLGFLAPKLEGALDCAAMLEAHEQEPHAKWVTLRESSGGYLSATVHACPISPAPLLRKHLWPLIRSAVVTSATLTSCGSFDFFMRESGLSGMVDVTTIEVVSPFDYPSQGTLRVHKTRAQPKDRVAFEAEMAAQLAVDLKSVTSGGLVLFASRKHMEAAVAAIDPGTLERSVLIQGTASRAHLLRTHKERVDAGMPSIILGLQSFGEGLDLPGKYCEHLFIAKLPFAPPTDPVAQARSAWMQQTGRDSFYELVVPQTGVKMCQWIGRAIRTETDKATVTCYDKRLTDTQYGRKILLGLPPFTLAS